MSQGEEQVAWFREAREHAWQWFALHANQRMQSLYFFLLAVAFISAAYVGALSRSNVLAGSLAALGVILTIAFRRLELRSRELLHLSELTLQALEQEMAAKTGVASIDLSKQAESSRLRFAPTYRWAILLIHVAVALGFTAAATFAFWRASQP